MVLFRWYQSSSTEVKHCGRTVWEINGSSNRVRDWQTFFRLVTLIRNSHISPFTTGLDPVCLRFPNLLFWRYIKYNWSWYWAIKKLLLRLSFVVPKQTWSEGSRMRKVQFMIIKNRWKLTYKRMAKWIFIAGICFVPTCVWTCTIMLLQDLIILLLSMFLSHDSRHVHSPLGEIHNSGGREHRTKTKVGCTYHMC